MSTETGSRPAPATPPDGSLPLDDNALGWETAGSDTNVSGDARQPRGQLRRQPENTEERLATGNINLGANVMQSLRLILDAAIRATASNPIMRNALGYSIAMLFVASVLVYLILPLIASMVRTSATAAVDYVWNPASMVVSRGTGALFAAGVYLGTVAGSVLGSAPSATSLPPVPTEYAGIQPSIQRVPLAHVHGMVLAKQGSAPHALELRRALDAQTTSNSDPSENDLHLLDGVVVRVPFALFDQNISNQIDTTAVQNDNLGNKMRRSLPAERAALIRFAVALHDESTLHQMSAALATTASTGWSTAWQTFLEWIRPSASLRLLRQTHRLRLIIESGLAGRNEWDIYLDDSEFSRLDNLDRPVCHASEMLDNARWQLEAKKDELLPPTIGTIDTIDDGSHAAAAPASNNRADGLAQLSSTLESIRHVQAHFGHLCQLAMVNQKTAIQVISKVADDTIQYAETLKSLDTIRRDLKANPPTDPATVLAYERRLFDVALIKLASIKYWEERQGSGQDFCQIIIKV